MKKILIWTVSVALSILAGLGVAYFVFTFGVRFFAGEPQPVEEVAVDTQDNGQIQELLNEKLALVATLNENEVFISSIKEHTGHDKTMSLHEIEKKDAEWMENNMEEVVEQHLRNETSLELLKFQEENPEFVEIFVTDIAGLVVGATNKTSDFYQADEQWWQDSYHGGTCKALHSGVEYDQSSEAEAISLHVPVTNEEKECLGVIKAVFHLTSIIDEL